MYLPEHGPQFGITRADTDGAGSISGVWLDCTGVAEQIRGSPEAVQHTEISLRSFSLLKLMKHLSRKLGPAASCPWILVSIRGSPHPESFPRLPGHYPAVS